MKKLMSLLLAGLFVLAAAGCSKPAEAPEAPSGEGETAEPAGDDAAEGS